MAAPAAARAQGKTASVSAEQTANRTPSGFSRRDSLRLECRRKWRRCFSVMRPAFFPPHAIAMHLLAAAPSSTFHKPKDWAADSKQPIASTHSPVSMAARLASPSAALLDAWPASCALLVSRRWRDVLSLPFLDAVRPAHR